MRGKVFVALAALLIAYCNAEVVSSDDAVRAGIVNFQQMLNDTSSSKSGCYSHDIVMLLFSLSPSIQMGMVAVP